MLSERRGLGQLFADDPHRAGTPAPCRGLETGVGSFIKLCCEDERICMDPCFRTLNTDGCGCPHTISPAKRTKSIRKTARLSTCSEKNKRSLIKLEAELEPRHLLPLRTWPER